MRILVILILLAFGLQSQQTTVNGQQTLFFMSTDNSQQTTDIFHRSKTKSCTSDAYSRTVDCCPLSVDFYESQIRKADSLYKNYLPQSNFEEVKAAMEFFDSLRLSKTTDIFHRIFPNKRQRTMCTVPEPVEGTTLGASTSSATAYPRTVDCCPLSVDFSCAKAHYYHAVGLTEKGDIVGACEHYLTALEIMEPLVETSPQWRLMANDKRLKTKGKGLCDSASLRLCDSNKEDYENIRFVALIYTRLGRLFLNENYCDLAITKYSKALKHVEMIDEKNFKADLLKFLGNSYQLSINADSALYYYNESLKCNSSLPNKLDIEKSIAQILLYKGEKDSAYRLINDNLDKLEGYAAKYSYYQILGEMYHSDNLYDSAIKYLNLSMCATNKHTILASSNILTTIYDLIGNIDLKFFYDSISLSILSSNYNKSIYKTKLQNVYSEYENRKQVREIEKEKIESRKHIVKYLIISLSFTLVLVYIIFVLRHRYRKDKIKYDKKIFNMNSEISKKNVEIENGKQTISVINSELENLTKKYDKLSNDYISNKKELEKTLSRKVTKNDIRNFCNCENSKKILANIDNIKNSNLKINNLAALTNIELRQLLDDADICLYDFTATITNKYPKLNDEDLYCICLLLLNIKGPTIAALLGKEYNSVWSRIKKIYSIIGINSKENLHKIFL